MYMYLNLLGEDEIVSCVDVDAAESERYFSDAS